MDESFKNMLNGTQASGPQWWSRAGPQPYMIPSSLVLTKSFREFCADFLRHYLPWNQLRMATIWSVDPVNYTLICLASEGMTIDKLGAMVVDCATDLSGIAVESGEVVVIDDILKRRRDGRMFSDLHLVNELKIRRMISIPVINTWSMYHVLLIMNIFPSSPDMSPEICDFLEVTDFLGIPFEAFLRDQCDRFANLLGVRIAAIKRRTPQKVYRKVAELIREAVSADSVAIYMENARSDGVDRQEGIRDDTIGIDLVQINDLADKCWEGNREFLVVRGDSVTPARRDEFLAPGGSVKCESYAFVPLRDSTGHAKGTFCCARGGEFAASRAISPFTYEDIAVIEAIAQAFTPQLEIILADYQRTDSMNKLAHELRVPVVAFRAALERVQGECKAKGYTFQFEHFEELWTYCNVMNRLLMELDAVRKGSQLAPLVAQREHIFTEIIAPAARFLKPLLVKKGLSRRCIEYKDVYKTPAFYLDPELMTQAVFNLLDNAIKYSRDDPAKVKIEIEGNDADASYEILFLDNGIGIMKGWEEKIFDLGVRGPNAYKYDVAGEGLGLWFARGIVRRHGGDLVLRSSRDPTIFTIVFPNSLRNAPPQNIETEE